VKFAADGDDPGVEITEPLVNECRVAFQEFIDGVVIETGRCDSMKQAQAIQFV
jgi:hypothetical protein